MWTVFHLVSLYPVSAGPRLILFSWTTSKPLIRYPLQAYSSCLFAFGYLLAKVARKGVIGERLIRCFRSALTFPPLPPPPQDAAPQQANAQADKVQVTEADLPPFHLGGTRGRVVARWEGKSSRSNPANPSLPRQQPLQHQFRERICSNVCIPRSAACQFICIYVLRDWKMLLCCNWILQQWGIRIEVNFIKSWGLEFLTCSHRTPTTVIPAGPKKH